MDRAAIAKVFDWLQDDVKLDEARNIDELQLLFTPDELKPGAAAQLAAFKHLASALVIANRAGFRISNLLLCSAETR